jgi:hypothetical protein
MFIGKEPVSGPRLRKGFKVKTIGDKQGQDVVASIQLASFYGTFL